jgi:HME family heavy-metal exporter
MTVMLNKIIDLSLRNALLVLVCAVFLSVYGLYALTTLSVDVFPDLNRPVVTIFAEAEGLAPEEVEARITFPLESAMNGATGVFRVRSASSIGLALVWVEFDWSMDIYIARQIVTEKLQQVAANLPPTVKPVLGPISSIMGEIMLMGLTAEAGVTPMDLRTLADWTIRPRLLSIKGIAQITVIGGERKEYQVLVDPARLRSYNVSLHEVEEAIKHANTNSTGGFLIKGPEEVLIRNLGMVATLDDLQQAVVRRDRDAMSAGDKGTESRMAPHTIPLRLSQVAAVRFGGPLTKRGDAGVNGKPAVILSIQKQPHADTASLTKAIAREMASLKPNLPRGVTVHIEIFRQSAFIERAIKNVEDALRDGSILVVVILFFFLWNFRTTFITLTAIPLSLIVTVIMFRAFGLSINTMTLGGLAIAIGELVDDAIVGVENVYRRLRENRQRTEPRPISQVIFEASSEVRNSIVFATIIVILVFLPLFALSGIEGKIFSPLGVAYITSILVSMVVSLTVTPALCYYLLPSMKQMAHTTDSFFVTWLKRSQRRALDVVFHYRWMALGGTLGLFVVALVVAGTFGKEFLPPFNEGSVTINLLLPPGTSLEESNRLGTLAETLLLQVPEIHLTGRRTGRAELDDHAEGVHSSEIDVELGTSKRPKGEVLKDIRSRLDQLPGIVVNVGQPISHRIDHLVSGVRAQIAIKLFGPDLAMLRRKAAEIERVAATVPGIVDLQTEKQVLIPQLYVRLNRQKAAQYGAMVGEVAEYVEMALNGKVVTQVLDGQKSFDVVLRLTDEARNNVESIKTLPIDVDRGKLLPLGLLADIQDNRGPNIIVRENVGRRIVISANVAGRDLVNAVEDLRAQIARQVALPEGYFVSYGGQFESQASASRLMLFLGMLALLGIFIVLFMHFKRATIVLQIMLSIPFAFIGAVFGVYTTQGIFSIASLVGLITLTGIAARNGIMMLDHYLHLMRYEGESFDLHMIYRGARERLVPVLMTALTASLALLPILAGPEEPGREILFPVAVVIFSGLFSGTFLNLLITPLVFWLTSQKLFAATTGFGTPGKEEVRVVEE